MTYDDGLQAETARLIWESEMTIAWKQPYCPIRRLMESEKSHNIDVPLGNSVKGKCFACKGQARDTCYNCEKAICEQHYNPFVFLEMGHYPLLVFNLCPQCVEMAGMI